MKNSPRLTSRQAQMLRFFFVYRNEYGESPSLAITVHKLGLSSNRSAIDMIRSLIRKGFLVSSHKVSKSTHLTDTGIQALGLGPLAMDGRGVLHDQPSVTVLGKAPVHAEASWSTIGQPNWLDSSQPSGTAYKVEDEVTRLLRNAVMSLSSFEANGTDNDINRSRPLRILPVYLVSCGVLWLIFGSSLLGAICFVAISVLMIIRS